MAVEYHQYKNLLCASACFDKLSGMIVHSITPTRNIKKDNLRNYTDYLSKYLPAPKTKLETTLIKFHLLQASAHLTL